MKLGLFMMPLHDPKRDYTKVLEEDREAILLAEKLGYDEAWVGEHYSAATEPISDPLQFMATLIPITKSIKLGTSVLNLPQHHPAQVAGNCAMFDHLCRGRFLMGTAILRRRRSGAAAPRPRAMAPGANHPRHRERPGGRGLSVRRSLQLWVVLFLSPRQSCHLQSAQDIQAQRVDPR
jgi:alkanesulfonate monooxygenase SsuD/methylene tetrahydromethanopterin reductase-like flavin-dependent oxidoreductase (luciferase family)